MYSKNLKIWALGIIALSLFGCNTDKSKKKDVEYLFWNASLKTENSFIQEAVKEINQGSEESLVLQKYNSAETREEVIGFFEDYTGSRDIAKAILKYSDKYDVPPTLSFALSRAESSFDPKAINRNRVSIDRGLFQLNSSSFPYLTERQFFNVDTNSAYGIKHIRWCLDTGGNEVSALAMYNAGSGRVSGGGTPKMTLDYISKVQAFRNELLDSFNSEMGNLYRINTKNGKLVKDLTKPLEAH